MKVDSLKISTNLKNFRYINQPLPPPKRKTKKLKTRFKLLKSQIKPMTFLFTL